MMIGCGRDCCGIKYIRINDGDPSIEYFFFTILSRMSDVATTVDDHDTRTRISLEYSKTTIRPYEMHTARPCIRTAERKSSVRISRRKHFAELRCVGECVRRVPGFHQVRCEYYKYKINRIHSIKLVTHGAIRTRAYVIFKSRQI